MAQTYLIRATSDPQSSNTTATYSVWVKRAKLGADACIWGGSYYSSDNTFNIKFLSGDNLQIVTVRGASVKADLRTNRTFKDIGAWYHIVVAVDTTQSTASNRIKLYINGVQETSFSTNTQPSVNENLYLDSGAGANYYIGQRGGNTQYFDGCMSHFHYVDGSQLAPTVFGSTDSTTGEWQINTSPSYTVGTKGFFVLKDGNSGTDQSANSNNFTVGGGTLTKTEDNPSNNFATFNSISGANTMAQSSTFSNGNNTVVCSGSVYNPFGTTIGVNKGKYYAEFKSNNEPGDGMIGVFAKLGALTGNYFGSQTHQYSWYRTAGNVGRIRNNSSDIVTGIGAWTTNDIIGIALDCDNNKLYMHKNGTYISNGSGTGNPSSGTYGISITDPDDTDLGFYFMTAMDWGGSGRGNWSANFGNGFFGTTAVATNSGNGYQDADGNGIFNYTVPTNYRALCTKGLNQ